MAYTRINWQNEPSEATALNDVNLNKMDSAIYDHDQRLDTAEGDIGDIETALDNKVDKVTGKGLSEVKSLMITKLTDVGTDVAQVYYLDQSDTPHATYIKNGITVDSALSSSSTNPVQNKKVKEALDDKVDKESGKGLSTLLGLGITAVNTGTQIADILAIAQDGSEYHNYIKNGVVVDSALSSSSENPVQNKVVKAELDKKIDGTSEDELNVRSAMMLLTPPISNNAPYVKRIVGGGIPNPYLCKLKKLIGASVVWNQLVNTGTGSTVVNDVTITRASDGSVTLNGTCNATSGTAVNAYVFSISSQTSSNRKYVVGSKNTSSGHLTVTPNSYKNYTGYFRIWNGTFNVVIAIYGGETYNNEKVYPQAIDLTAMFGSTIADYVNTLETTEAGSGIAWLKSYGFFTEDYYAYSANTMQSVSVSAKVNKDSEDTTISTVALDHTELRGLFKLDANNNLYADGDEYLPSGGENVNYAEVDLGDLNYTITASGLFQTLIPTAKPASTSSTIADIMCPLYTVVTSNNITGPQGTNPSPDMVMALNADNTNTRLYINNLSYTDATALKNAMAGVKLQFKLKTATTATLTPYTSLKNIESGGTEEFIDYGVEQGTRDVAIPCGQESEYNSGVTVPNLPTSGGKVALNYDPSNGKFSWE